jgi:CBS domain containing-hemolysin-like protein
MRPGRVDVGPDVDEWMSGLVLDQLGEVPEPGEEIETAGYL